MQTQCIQKTFEFQALGRREVVARFDGGPITADAGGLHVAAGDPPVRSARHEVGPGVPTGPAPVERGLMTRTVRLDHAPSPSERVTFQNSF